MSMFLPEGAGGQPKSGVAAISPANPETTQDDIALMQRVFAAASRNPNLIPTDFMAYFVDFLQTQRLDVPLGQVIGYRNSVNSIVAQSLAAALAGQFVWHVANAENEQSVTWDSYAAWSGAPALSGLDNGSWFVAWGCSAKGDDAASGSALKVAVQANGGSYTNFAESQEQSYYTSIARGDAITLSAGAGANTLQSVALTTISGHTSKVRSTWIAAVKYSN